jgi:glutathione peroxidase
MKLNARQRLLKWVYPFFLLYKKVRGENKTIGTEKKSSPVSIYDFSVELNNGKELALDGLRGRKILIVNTASNCGYTNQYAELQTLYRHSKEDLEIIGFPANDFKEQEKGSDEEIARFCQVNFGVSFPLAKKSTVKKAANQNKIFQWLTHKELNGWNDKEPSWNFSKYLVDEEGFLTHYFDPAVSPLSEEVINAVHQ